MARLAYRICVQTAHPPSDWKSFPYGQNVAWSHPSFQDSLEAWFDEYKVSLDACSSAPRSLNRCHTQPYVDSGVDPLVFRSADDPERVEAGLGQIGHFTAMAAAASTHLGCSAAGGDNYRLGVVHVCNYSPPGNMVGVEVWRPSSRTLSFFGSDDAPGRWVS